MVNSRSFADACIFTCPVTDAVDPTACPRTTCCGHSTGPVERICITKSNQHKSRAVLFMADRVGRCGRRCADILLALASALLIVLVLAHANLVATGQWQGDEYDYAAGVRDGGFPFVLQRLAFVTPRPISELLILAYVGFVNWFHQPLIGPFLAFGWAIFLLGCCARLVVGSNGSLLPRIFLAASLVSLFLLGHSVADMFYWPVGMAPYVPTVTALCFLTILILDGGLNSFHGRSMAMIALIIAAGSSETGAFVVLYFTMTMGVMWGRQRLQTGGATWLILPFVLSIAVFIGIRVGRAAGPPTLASLTGHHVLASLRVATLQTLRDMALIDQNDGGWGQQGLGSVQLGIPIKLLILAGFTLLSRHCFGEVARGPVLALVLSLLVGMATSIFGADYQFGFLCCQRHEAARQCMMVMVLLACGCLIGMAARRSEQGSAWPLAGATCLMLAIAPMVIWRLPDLIEAYGSMAVSQSSLYATWKSGLAPGGTAVITQQPAALLVHVWSFPPGNHVLTVPQRYDVRSAMRFFRKQQLMVLPPSSSASGALP